MDTTAATAPEAAGVIHGDANNFQIALSLHAYQISRIFTHQAILGTSRADRRVWTDRAAKRTFSSAGIGGVFASWRGPAAPIPFREGMHRTHYVVRTREEFVMTRVLGRIALVLMLLGGGLVAGTAPAISVTRNDGDIWCC